MTQLEALKELLEKVEAGNWGPFDGPSNETGLSDWCLYFDKIMLENSMDTALSLFDAVLPGGTWHLTSSGTAIVDTYTASHVVKHEDGHHPVRALLIAIIKAKIAELEA